MAIRNHQKSPPVIQQTPFTSVQGAIPAFTLVPPLVLQSSLHASACEMGEKSTFALQNTLRYSGGINNMSDTLNGRCSDVQGVK